MIARSPRPDPGYLDRLNQDQRTAVLHSDGEVASSMETTLNHVPLETGTPRVRSS